MHPATSVDTRAHKAAGSPVYRSSSFPPSRPHSWRWSVRSRQALTPFLSGLAAQTALARSVPVLRAPCAGVNRVHMRASVPILFMPPPTEPHH